MRTTFGLYLHLNQLPSLKYLILGSGVVNCLPLFVCFCVDFLAGVLVNNLQLQQLKTDLEMASKKCVCSY